MAPVSDAKTLARPMPVTLAASLIIMGSVSIIALAFGAISELRSIETRGAVERALAEWPLRGTGLTIESTLSLIRASAMIAGACAAAMAVLGVFVFRRNAQARLGLSALAVPLLLTGLVTGGFMVTLVVVATITLWLQPARDWFAGIAPAAGAANRERARQAQLTPPGLTPQDRATPSAEWPPPATLNVPVPTSPALPDGDARPKAVTAACLSAWVGSGLTMLVIAVSLAILSANPDAVLAELEKQQPETLTQELTGDALISASMMVGGIVIAMYLPIFKMGQAV